MNERIKELVEQATTIYHGVIVDFDKEKFAELIVQEVFSKIEDERYELYPPVIDAVKTHFGIKDEQSN